MKGQAAVVASLVVLGGLLAGVPAAADAPAESPAGTQGGPTAAATAAAANHTNASENASLGASISSFMQASAADAGSSVETGMWSAAFGDSNESERARLIHQRTDELRERLRELRAERQRLLNGSDGNVTLQDRAEAARLAARAKGLERAIDRTAEAANRSAVNATELDELRRNASNLTGPEVAAIATGLVDVDRGPPEDAGDGDGGPPEDAGDGDGGPPEDAGNGTDGGPPDDGNGNDGGPPEDGTGNDGDRGSGGNGGNEAGSRDS